MKYATWALALSMATALGGIAVAQPQPGDPAVGDPMQPQPQPQPEPQPQPPPPQPEPQPTAPAPMEGVAGRPDGIAFGIGAGYEFPTPLEMMNNFSARLRLISGMTLEPRVVLRNQSTSDDTTGSTQQFKFAMGVRAPLITRGKFDFELLGEGAFTSVKSPQPLPLQDESVRSSALALGWGIGIAWWITPHFQFTASATNPIVNFQRSSASNTDETSSTTDIGLIFDPRVSMMLHIYN